MTPEHLTWPGAYHKKLWRRQPLARPRPLAYRAPLMALDASLKVALTERLRPDQISEGVLDRAAYARDMWPRLLLSIRDGKRLPHQPDIVLWPESPEEVAAIVVAARKNRTPIVPYGAGSGVCGGALAIYQGITIDTKRMDRVLDIDSANLEVRAQCGINGERLERELQAAGFTLGHFPSSIYCSTLGGWLAARSAGQMSTKYGKIEDMVLGVQAVTGRGDIIETGTHNRAEAGPNFTQLLVGSEGTLGVLTEARLRVHPLPEKRLLRGFSFPNVYAGLEAIRDVLQAGLEPAVVRLYDEFDSVLAFRSKKKPVHESHSSLSSMPVPGMDSQHDEGAWDLLRLIMPGSKNRKQRFQADMLAMLLRKPSLVNALAETAAQKLGRQGCLFIVGCEGPARRTEVEASAIYRILERHGGTDLGPEPGQRWFDHRYSVSYKMSKVFEAGSFVDTMEVAATWDRLYDLYSGVRAAIGEHAFVMAHFSHAYPEGCSIYFTFVGHGKNRKQAEAIYDRIWRSALEAAVRAGGTIAHHHGVGLLKAPFMKSEHRGAMDVYRAIKRCFDPDNILNPGKMGLPKLK